MSGTDPSQRGSLSVVGIGIRFGLQTTPEARHAIERADRVLYLVADPLPAGWIEELNGRAHSLRPHYERGKPRRASYEAMVEEILSAVRAGHEVCAVFYGHPGVYVTPSHEAIRRAREEGFHARMLPGVSAEDCLFADLGVDPGDGWQSYEATNFLLYPRRFDPTVQLVLWQVSVVGEVHAAQGVSRTGLRVLAERLLESYPPGHEVVLYEAETYPIGESVMERIQLEGLAEADCPPMATLYVPPLAPPMPDSAMFQRLGIAVPEAVPGAKPRLDRG